jgi:biotin carboxylase
VPLLPNKSLALNFFKPQETIKKISEYHQTKPFRAIIGIDEETVILAAMACEVIGLKSNSVSAVQATRDKYRLRRLISDGGLKSPKFDLFSINEHNENLGKEIHYPCVLKPTFLSASRGVIRVNNEQEFSDAFSLIRHLLSQKDIKKKGGESAGKIMMEGYIPGKEVALEGIMVGGKLKVFAIFDKPDPLEGPYFIETIYVTPSRHPEKVQAQIVSETNRVLETIGLTHGPIHCELRLNSEGAWIVEVAARSIGGLCSRVLKFQNGISLEEVILRHAIGETIHHIYREEKSAGVMMIPVPKAGILKEVRGLEEIRSISGIENVVISIGLDQTVTPPPIGSKYLGFIFADGKLPGEVEQTIREVYNQLEIEII